MSNYFKKSCDSKMEIEELNEITNKNLPKQKKAKKKQKNKKQIQNSSRESQFLTSYKSDIILEKIPDLSNCLIKTSIKKQIRAQMLDWIIEVLQALSEKKDLFPTLFRTILIQDLYLKYSEKALKDTDIHLIGITCMYISSKFEDIYPISILDFFDKVGHGAFSTEEIREKEFDVLRTLGFSLNFSTFMDVADFHMKNVFERDKCKKFFYLREIVLCFLVICLHEDGFNNFDSNLLVFACITKAVEYYFSYLAWKGLGDTGKAKDKEKNLIKQILSNSYIEKYDLKELRKKIDKYIDQFSKNEEFQHSLKLLMETRKNIEF